MRRCLALAPAPANLPARAYRSPEFTSRASRFPRFFYRKNNRGRPCISSARLASSGTASSVDRYRNDIGSRRQERSRIRSATRNVTGHSQSISINTILINKTSVPLSRKSERASARNFLRSLANLPLPSSSLAAAPSDPPPPRQPARSKLGMARIYAGSVISIRSSSPPLPPEPPSRHPPRVPYPLRCNLFFFFPPSS
jgi:hypothetical protein